MKNLLQNKRQLAIIGFVCLFILSNFLLLVHGPKLTGWLLIGYIIGNIIFLLILLYMIFIYHIVVTPLSNNKVKKYCRISFVILTIALLTLPFVFMLHVPTTNHNWDFFHIYNHISYLRGRSFTHLPMTQYEQLYYLHYSNNQFFGLILNRAFSIFSTNQTRILAMTAVSTFLTTIAVLSGSFLIKKLSDSKSVLIYNLVALGFLPFYFYGAELYTDSASLPFVVLTALFTICALKTNKVTLQFLYWGLAGAIGFLGFFIKPTVVFSLIAAILFLLLNRKWKKLAIMLPTLLFLFLVVNNEVKNFLHTEPSFSAANNTRYNLPDAHWITMSFAPKNTTGGFYRPVLDYSMSFPNKAEKQKADLRLLAKNLKQEGILGFFLQIGRKIIYTYGWGDLQALHYTQQHQNPIVSKLFDWVYKDELTKTFSVGNFYGYLLLFIAQEFYWFSILFFLIYSIFFIVFKKYKDESFVLSLSTLGLMFFLLIWEANARYLYNFSPILIILSSLGMLKLSEKRMKRL